MAVRRSAAGEMGQAAARRLPRRRADCGREGEETAGVVGVVTVFEIGRAHV